ncbi:homeodomain-like superfamily protein [Actinidia rufa]|uniref:Homeodomain-like superfamily protein n=1 Tax=Actinidia rufa TaxID=165716 RepID=A0A7J0F8L6_9ERIC|nr:homeodomain-like superfamily protein [Actinidia rufa]
MGSIPPELSLDIRPTFVPKTTSRFLGEITEIGKISERLLRIEDFLKRLEDEMRKIDAFKRELPLSMMLLNDAIVILKEESMQCRTRNIEPVLEEFIPLKKNCDEEEKIETIKVKNNRDKVDWMSSVQLWNTDDTETTDSKKQNSMKGGEEGCKKGTGSRAFMSFEECLRKEDKGELSVAGLSLGIKNPRGKVSSSGLVSKTRGIRPVSSSTPISKSNLRAGPLPLQYQNARKQRRCWSPELHRRFVTALQQLGGPQVATPKQIRERMQVDGLTNDEIKSHLQKYRLHARKPPAAANKSTVNFGGLWLAPPQDDRFSASVKQSNSKSGSPKGPLQLDGGGTCTTGEDEEEDYDDDDDDDNDDDDGKSECYGWKIHIPKSGN